MAQRVDLAAMASDPDEVGDGNLYDDASGF
jgi:hypothetical protein